MAGISTHVSRVAPTRDLLKDALPTELPHRSFLLDIKFAAGKNYLMSFFNSEGNFCFHQKPKFLFASKILFCVSLNFCCNAVKKKFGGKKSFSSCFNETQIVFFRPVSEYLPDFFGHVLPLSHGHRVILVIAHF